MAQAPETKDTSQKILNRTVDGDYGTMTAQVYGERASAARRISSVDAGGGVEALAFSGSISGGQVNAHPVTSAGVSLVDTQGGQTYQKVGEVARIPLAQSTDAVTVYGSDDGGTTKRVIKTDSGGAVAADIESIAAGDNNIGNVDLASAIPAGTNDIGSLTIADVTATGSITGAAQTVQVALAGRQTVALVLTGTWTATLIPEFSMDGGTTWSTAVVYFPASTASSSSSSLTANGQAVYIGASGASHVRVRCSSFSSGTVSVAFRSVLGGPNFAVVGALSTGTPGVYRPFLDGADNADAQSSLSTNTLRNRSSNFVYNGSTWDRLRGSTTGVQTIGGLGHDAADTAANQPQKIGLQARTTNPSAVADGDVTNATGDDLGRQVVVIDQVRDLVTQQNTTITSSVTETTILTAVASTFLDLKAITIANSSATAARVDIKDSTAGTTRFSLYVPAGDTRGIVFQTPLPQATVNNNWTATSSASVASLYIFCQAVKNV